MYLLAYFSTQFFPLHCQRKSDHYELSIYNGFGLVVCVKEIVLNFEKTTGTIFEQARYFIFIFFPPKIVKSFTLHDTDQNRLKFEQYKTG